jgi:hypothetical protein
MGASQNERTGSKSSGVSTVTSPSSATFGRPMIRRLIE